MGQSATISFVKLTTKTRNVGIYFKEDGYIFRKSNSVIFSFASLLKRGGGGSGGAMVLGTLSVPGRPTNLD